MRRPAAALAAALTLALAATSCGSSQEDTPSACLAGARSYLDALRAAPGEVRLRGTPISHCLVEGQAGGELATVGVATVEAATRLNAEGRADPAGPAPLRLGYLVGAVERGAAETGGIHADLVRRLESAAGFEPSGGALPAPYRAAYARGVDAGKARG